MAGKLNAGVSSACIPAARHSASTCFLYTAICAQTSQYSEAVLPPVAASSLDSRSCPLTPATPASRDRTHPGNLEIMRSCLYIGCRASPRKLRKKFFRPPSALMMAKYNSAACHHSNVDDIRREVGCEGEGV